MLAAAGVCVLTGAVPATAGADRAATARSYLLIAAEQRLPAGLEQRVTAIGGRVTLAVSEIGVAAVRAITPELAHTIGVSATGPLGWDPDGWTAAEGTSAATPHVAGVAALVVGAHGGHLQPAAVEVILRASADDLGEPGRDDFYGYGRVNAATAVAEP